MAKILGRSFREAWGKMTRPLILLLFLNISCSEIAPSEDATFDMHEELRCDFGTRCGNECIDMDSDIAHCGGCFSKCPYLHMICNRGYCECDDNWLTCEGALPCQTHAADLENCGACGIECRDGEECNAGKCSCDGEMRCGEDETCSDGLCF